MRRKPCCFYAKTMPECRFLCRPSYLHAADVVQWKASRREKMMGFGAGRSGYEQTQTGAEKAIV
jgi:hypothetical protein